MDTAASGCPTDNGLAEYAANPAGREAVARHLDRCADCRRVVDQARAAKTGTDDAIARRVLHDDPPAMVADLVGTTLGRRYEITGLLGRGGMGSVFEARHTGTRRVVAVKVIARLLAPSGEARERFRREAQALGGIEHPHVVTVIDSGEDEATGDLYLVMERLRGEDLRSLIEQRGPLPPHVAIRIAAQALKGLAKVHEAGIVHRDVKPANLFLASRDDGEVTVKVLDFGVAKITADLPEAAGLTGSAVFLGTPLYSSPEHLWSSKGVDHRADLWSLGSVLYHALTGRAPFAQLGSVGLATCGAEPPPIRALAPWVSLPLAKVVHRALARDRDQRYPSAGAMLGALRRLLPDCLRLREEMLREDWQPAPVPPPPWRRGPIALLALFLGANLEVCQPRPPPPPQPEPGTLCVTPAPWTIGPQQFTAPGYPDELPPGTYTLTYEGGAMSHGSPKYEVTAHYLTNEGVECGHHLYNGPNLSTSAWKLWLDADGLVPELRSIPAVERANAGHQWPPFWFPGGPLHIVFVDDYYPDNRGPGSVLCVSPQGAP